MLENMVLFFSPQFFCLSTTTLCSYFVYINLISLLVSLLVSDIVEHGFLAEYLGGDFS